MRHETRARVYMDAGTTLTTQIRFAGELADIYLASEIEEPRREVWNLIEAMRYIRVDGDYAAARPLLDTQAEMAIEHAGAGFDGGVGEPLARLSVLAATTEVVGMALQMLMLEEAGV